MSVSVVVPHGPPRRRPRSRSSYSRRGTQGAPKHAIARRVDGRRQKAQDNRKALRIKSRWACAPHGAPQTSPRRGGAASGAQNAARLIVRAGRLESPSRRVSRTPIGECFISHVLASSVAPTDSWGRIPACRRVRSVARLLVRYSAENCTRWQSTHDSHG